MLGGHGWPWCTTTVDFGQRFVAELQRTNGSDYVNLAGPSPRRTPPELPSIKLCRAYPTRRTASLAQPSDNAAYRAKFAILAGPTSGILHGPRSAAVIDFM